MYKATINKIIMEPNQIQLLKSLAKKLKSEDKSKAKILASFQSAKILDKKGNFTRHFSNLKKVVTSSK